MPTSTTPDKILPVASRPRYVSLSDVVVVVAVGGGDGGGVELAWLLLVLWLFVFVDVVDTVVR